MNKQDEQELPVSLPANYRAPWLGRHFLGVMMLLLIFTFAFAIAAFVLNA